ncbi:MAG TPA: tRNA pseudouridine(55) synthase TruB [Alphaproteobacteria bacterium]|nr:tRNA pseudouridine(55) synthase TruB [Alphaproteobacteria bacterium]
MHGLLLLNKPTGITSNAALSRVKRLLKTKSAGFAGTLDPMATGVLPIALGEATKCLPYIEDVDKEYTFTIKWGVETDTLDAEGKIMAENPHRPTENEIQNILKNFTGEITQIPPKFSAIKINGQRAYDLARAGEKVEIKPRTITIHDLALTAVIDPNHAAFRVTCSKGTYIRTLAADMAVSLGTLGHLTQLCRSRVGKFTLSSTISLEKLLELPYEQATQWVMPIRTMLDDIPALALDPGALRRLRQGQFLNLAVTAASYPPGTHILVLDGEAAFGMAMIKEDKMLWPRRLFNL